MCLRALPEHRHTPPHCFTSSCIDWDATAALVEWGLERNAISPCRSTCCPDTSFLRAYAITAIRALCLTVGLQGKCLDTNTHTQTHKPIGPTSPRCVLLFCTGYHSGDTSCVCGDVHAILSMCVQTQFAPSNLPSHRWVVTVVG